MLSLVVLTIFACLTVLFLVRIILDRALIEAFGEEEFKNLATWAVNLRYRIVARVYFRNADLVGSRGEINRWYLPRVSLYKETRVRPYEKDEVAIRKDLADITQLLQTEFSVCSWDQIADGALEQSIIDASQRIIEKICPEAICAFGRVFGKEDRVDYTFPTSIPESDSPPSRIHLSHSCMQFVLAFIPPRPYFEPDILRIPDSDDKGPVVSEETKEFMIAKKLAAMVIWPVTVHAESENGDAEFKNGSLGFVGGLKILAPKTSVFGEGIEDNEQLKVLISQLAKNLALAHQIRLNHMHAVTQPEIPSASRLAKPTTITEREISAKVRDVVNTEDGMKNVLHASWVFSRVDYYQHLTEDI